MIERSVPSTPKPGTTTNLPINTSGFGQIEQAESGAETTRKRKTPLISSTKSGELQALDKRQIKSAHPISGSTTVAIARHLNTASFPRKKETSLIPPFPTIESVFVVKQIMEKIPINILKAESDPDQLFVDMRNLYELCYRHRCNSINNNDNLLQYSIQVTGYYNEKPVDVEKPIVAKITDAFLKELNTCAKIIKQPFMFQFLKKLEDTKNKAERVTPREHKTLVFIPREHMSVTTTLSTRVPPPPFSSDSVASTMPLLPPLSPNSLASTMPPLPPLSPNSVASTMPPLPPLSPNSVASTMPPPPFTFSSGSASSTMLPPLSPNSISTLFFPEDYWNDLTEGNLEIVNEANNEARLANEVEVDNNAALATTTSYHGR